MDKFIQNILLIIAICCVAYLVFRSIGFKTREGLEGMENSEGEHNYGGNASVYASNLKTHVDKYHDRALIPKYRPDYENVVMHLDDLTNHLMLHTAMSVDHKDPNSAVDALSKISSLNNSKAGLNNIMKFIDSK
jgi:hypothetical protein